MQSYLLLALLSKQDPQYHPKTYLYLPKPNPLQSSTQYISNLPRSQRYDSKMHEHAVFRNVMFSQCNKYSFTLQEP